MLGIPRQQLNMWKGEPGKLGSFIRECNQNLVISNKKMLSPISRSLNWPSGSLQVIF